MAASVSSEQPQSKWQYFEKGTHLLLDSWTALRLAVEGGWGGGNSERKYEVLVDEILFLFKKHATVYMDDLAVNIEDYLEEEFNLVCEDGSVDEIATILTCMAKECQANDFSRVEKLMNDKNNAIDRTKLPSELKSPVQ